MLKARVLVGYFGQVTFLSLQFFIYKWVKGCVVRVEIINKKCLVQALRRTQ